MLLLRVSDNYLYCYGRARSTSLETIATEGCGPQSRCGHGGNILTGYRLQLVNSLENVAIFRAVGNAAIFCRQCRAETHASASQTAPEDSFSGQHTDVIARPLLQHVVMATVPFMTSSCLFSCIVVHFYSCNNTSVFGAALAQDTFHSKHSISRPDIRMESIRAFTPIAVTLYTSVPRSFLPTAHPTLTMAREGTPQNFALRKGGTKQCMATKMRILCVHS
jgi:hypothetical protein